MEFGLREWMILISGLLIIVVIVDGVRRMLADRRHQVRMGMSYHDDEEGEEEHDDYFEDNPELPNGGARVRDNRVSASSEPVIGSLDIDDEAPFRDHFSEPVFAPAAKTVSEAVIPKTASRAVHSEADSGRAVPESSPLEAMSAERPASDVLPAELTSAEPVMGAERPPRERRKMPSFRRGAKTDEAPAAKEPVVEQAPPAATTAVSESSEEAPTEPLPKESVAAEATKPAEKSVAKEQPEEVLMINVCSRDANGFNGSDLLEVLLACDVRFGEMNIFHRYEGAQGKGPIQFSVANMVKPGTFDLDTIKEFYTPGITFFMQLPGPADPLGAFDCMAEVAACMVRNLQAEMRDEGHSVLTPQTLEHYRERVRNYERKRLMRAKRKA